MVAALSGETAAWFIGGGVAARGQISNWVLSSVVAKLSQNSLRLSLYLSLTYWAIAVVFEGVCMCVSIWICVRESVCVCVCVFCNTFKDVSLKKNKRKTILKHIPALSEVYTILYSIQYILAYL